LREILLVSCEDGVKILFQREMKKAMDSFGLWD